MSDPKKNTTAKPDSLAEALRAAIERTEAKHAEIYGHDMPSGGRYTHIGTRWSEAMLRGSSYEPAPATAREAARGMWSACIREAGGCGGSGFKGDGGQRIVCTICNGAGRIPSEAGLELARFLAQMLAPTPKPDASAAAIEAHNARVEEARRQREEAQQRQDERVRQERAILGEASAKLAALRGEAVDPLAEHDHARRVHEAHNPPGEG